MPPKILPDSSSRAESPRPPSDGAGESPGATAPGSVRSGPSPLQVVLYAVPVLALELGAWAHRWVTEDAFIYFRVVDNTFAGHGPVFNAGERVEAATGTLWTGLLVVGRALLGWLVPVEWLAVGLGLGLTGLAVVAAQLGAARLARARQPDIGWLWPAGILVVVALPPMWDFATSGLESSLEFAWIAVVFWSLARHATSGRPDGPQRPWWLSVLIGLGPLIRPDLAIFSAVYLLALWLSSPGRWRDRGTSLAWAAAVPLLWEVFRLGFYGALVPNTAIAKSAGSANLKQGWAYLLDFVQPYWLVVPAVLLVALLVARSPADVRVRARTIVSLAPVAGALASFLYILRLGGDFMHARFWLPSVFAAVLPISVLPVPRLRTWRASITIAALAGLLVWGLAASRVVVPYARDINPDGIADERGFWERAAGRDNPVTLADFDRSFLVGDARKELAEARAIGPDAVVVDTGDEHVAAPSPAGTGAHLAYRNIGVYGLAAGRDTTVIDPHGLSDALAARLELTSDRERPGHEKNLPPVWILARYAAPTDHDSSELRAARHALSCGDLAEVVDATTQPLTPSRFLQNLTGALHRTRVVVPADPIDAERHFCAP